MRKVIRSVQLFAACGVLSAGLVAAAQIPSASAAATNSRHHSSQARPVAHPIPPGITFHAVKHAKHGAPSITGPRDKRSIARRGSGNMLYNGGAVQNAPTVYILFWGSWWSSTCASQQGNGGSDEGYLYDYFHALSGPDDGWSAIMSQYGDQFGDTPTFPRAIWGGWAVDCNDPPQTASFSQLASEAAGYAQFLAGGGTTIDGNTQIIVVSPSGTNPGGGFGNQYCAWHSWTAYSGGNDFSFTNLPYLPDQGSNCGANTVQNGFDGWSIVGGHEYAESVTDPFLNAWFDSSGTEGEIGDKCAWTNLFAENMGGAAYAQQPLWDNNTASCQQVTSLPDSVAVTPVANQSNNLGDGVNLQIQATSSSGFTLSYQAFGLPPGLSIDPSTGLIFGTVTFPGNYNAVVEATDSTLAVASQGFSWSVNTRHGAIKSYDHRKHCVDDFHGSLVSGTPVDLYRCNGTLGQTWASFPGGSLRRFGGAAAIDTNRCVNIFGARTANGTKINLRPCTGAWNQVWVFRPATHHWLNPHSGKCLDDPGGNLTNFTRLVLNSCNGSSAEKWTNN